MSLSMAMAGGPLAYRGPRAVSFGERTMALGAVLILHVLLIGVLLIARAHQPAAPQGPTISVSLITESAAPAPRPAPAPQPVVAPPETRMIATPRPTPSPMAAPPVETPSQPQATSAAPPSPAAPAPSAPAASAPSAAITPPNFTAAYLNNPGAVYPPSARRKRVEGTVRLRVQVSAEGAPLQVLVDRTSGSADLDQAAQQVVKTRWKFAPARQGERAVAAWVIVPMEFSLKR